MAFSRAPGLHSMVRHAEEDGPIGIQPEPYKSLRDAHTP
jgi:hypothetical protein